MIKKYIVYAVVFISMYSPVLAHGQIKISEIMYDPLGSDTKTEWIEVYNEGDTVVDLSTYFLLENNTNHKLVEQREKTLASHGYAIIVNSVPEVLANYPDFDGVIFDSTFSLVNTGETIAITNQNKVIEDEFTYASDMGGNNTGHSLQITNGVVITATPTFGFENKTESEVIESDEEEDIAGDSTSNTSSTSSSGTISTHTEQTNTSTYTPTTFKIGAGRNRLVSIHTPIEFIGTISKSETRAKYIWNFGDFDTRTGKKVKHIYHYAGIYEVVLNASSKDADAVSRTRVVAIEPQLSFIQHTDSHTFEIINSDTKEINIGGFILIYENGEFIIPQDTIVSSKSTRVIADFNLGLFKRVSYPDGTLYQEYADKPSVISDSSTMQNI